MKNNLLFNTMLIGSSLSLVGCGTNTQSKKDAEKPNIIYILTDDLGYGDIGALFQKQREIQNNRTEPWQRTPNLDRLAADGVHLSQHYSNSPVSAPSRASLLTGMHQGHANVRNNQFDKALEDNHTLGNVLQTLGYTTVAVGKWGLQGNDNFDVDGESWPAYPLKRGFDDFFGYVRHGDGHEHYPKEGVYRGAKEVYHNYDEIADQLDKCYTGDLWTAYAKKWIVAHQQNNHNKPFFMYLAYDTPHAVLELPTQAYPKGGGLNGGLQWLGKPGQMINTASGEVDSWIHPDYEHATWDDDNNPSTAETPWPETYKRHATSVRRIDDAVGDLRQLLKDLKIEKNTIIVFTSDNGTSDESYLPEGYVHNHPTFFKTFGPFDGLKRDCWEGGLRVPLIVAWPSVIPENRVVDTPGMLSDWMATFCDINNVAPPANSDGVSLMPALTGKGTQQESRVYVEYFFGGRTPNYEEFEAGKRQRPRNQMQIIRLGNYKGVRYDIKSADDNFEIYDVMNDPKETTNLANYPKMNNLQQQMKEKVLQIRRPNPTAVRPYDNEHVPAASTTKTLSKGVSWSAYDGIFPWVPGASFLTNPKNTGQAGNLDASLIRSPKNSAFLFQGYIDIPEDGEYTFHLNTSNKAVLKMHEITLIDADYGCANGAEREAVIKLKKGFHPFYLCSVPGGDESSLKLEWSSPNMGRTSVPDTAFYH